MADISKKYANSQPLFTSEKDRVQTKILVVEDNTIAMKAVGSMLTKMNFHVDIADEGQKAIQLAKNNHYDLIFMDIGVPDIDGYKITASIRTNEKNKTPVPIVALTAYIDEATKIKCIDIGMNDIVTKPLSTAQAEEILAALILHRSSIPKMDNFNIAEKKEEYASLPLFDFTCVLNRFQDEKTARNLVTLFVKKIPEIRTTLKSAYDIQDWKTIQNIACDLQGETSYCGLKQLH